MRSGDFLAPRWRSILLLLVMALAIAALTQYYLEPAGGGRRSANLPSTRAAPRAGAGSALAGSSGTQARSETSLPHGPIISGPIIPGPIISGPIISPDGPQESASAPGEEASQGSMPPGKRAPGESLAARELPRLIEEMGRPVAVVSAQVIDPSGMPVPGVQVRLGDREAVTDSQGEFILPQKTAPLLLHHPAYLPRSIDPDLLRGIAIPDADPAFKRIVVVIFPGGRVKGRVVHGRGIPVPGAQVAFDGEETPAAGTSSEGEFQSAILRPGVHHVQIQHPDYQRAAALVNIPAGGGEVPFTATLKPGVPLDLQVLDGAGAGVTDAAVWLVRRGGRGAEEARLAGRTGDDGRLALRWDPADPHLVRVIAPGYREILEPLSGERMALRLDRAPLLTGLVLDREKGLPVRPKEIYLEVESPEGTSRAPDRGILFRTLAAGKFRVGLPPFSGTYRVRAIADGDLSGISDRIAFDGKTDPEPATVYLTRRQPPKRTETPLVAVLRPKALPTPKKT